jgi:peptidoglycan/LPS O-acetylase OafA/YrhL
VHNVRPMEGLRGFAVFLVFLVHYVTLVRPWIAGESALLVLASALHTIRNTGVDLFFVLSGYLIYGSLISRSQQFVRFVSRRVERIYPTFVAVFVLYAVLSFPPWTR